MTPLPKDAACRHCGDTYATALSQPQTPDGYCSPSCAHTAHLRGPWLQAEGGDDPVSPDTDARRCVGCGLAAEPGDVYCTGCRQATDAGSNPRDWPPPLS